MIFQCLQNVPDFETEGGGGGGGGAEGHLLRCVKNVQSSGAPVIGTTSNIPANIPLNGF